MNIEIPEIKNVNGWVLFDGECRFCTAFAHRFTPLLRRYGLVFVPLQTPWVEAQFKPGVGTTWTEMVLLKLDGATFGGADALLEIARNVWWAQPLYWFSHLPGMKSLLRKVYAWIARHRHCLGGACRTQPHRSKRAFFEMP